MPADPSTPQPRGAPDQAVQVPCEFDREGSRALIEPNRLLEMLAALEPLEDGMLLVEDLPPPERDIF